MFIRNRNNYLLLENLKQAREYLTKKNIPLDLPEFLHITKSLEKLPNLIDPFTRMIFKDDDGRIGTDASMDEFDRIIDWVKTNKNIVSQLPRNLNQYKELEDIADDIMFLKHRRKVYLFTKSLYSSMRDQVKKLEGDDLDTYSDLATGFMDLTSEEKSSFTPLKYFKANNVSIEEFMDSIDRFIHSQDVNENRNKVLKYIEDNQDKLKVVYNENNVIAIQSNDKEAVCELGSQQWCIVYSPDTYQRQYFGPSTMNTQYIIHNFNLPASNSNSMFGITIDIEGKARNGSQDKMNRNIGLPKILELTGIPEGTLVSIHKSRYEELEKEYNNITNETPQEEIKLFRKITMDLGVHNGFNEKLEEWVANYANIELINPLNQSLKGELMGIREYLERRRKVVVLCDDLRITFDLSSVNTEYANNTIKEIDLVDSSMDQFLIKITELKLLLDTLGFVTLSREDFNDRINSLTPKITLQYSSVHDQKDNIILTETLKWVANNISDTSYEHNRDIITKILKNKSINSKIVGTYLLLIHPKELESIKKEITKNKESLEYYFINHNELVKLFQLNFNICILKAEGISLDTLHENSYSLTELVYLLFIYAFHVNNLYGDNINATLIDDKYITLDSIIHLNENINELGKKLSEIPITQRGEEVHENDLALQVEGVVYELSENFMNVSLNSEINSVTEFINIYNKLETSIDDFPEFIENNISEIYDNYGETDELADFLIDNVTDIQSLLDFDSYSSPEEEYVEYVGSLLIKSIEKKSVVLNRPITELQSEIENDVVRYAMYLAEKEGTEYKEIFFNSIGLEKKIETYTPRFHNPNNEEKEVEIWFYRTDYGTLGSLFYEEFDFENHDWWDHYYYDNSSYTEYYDELDISNIILLANYFKSKGFNIDLTSLDKYLIPENFGNNGNYFNIKYQKSNEYYRDDKELKELKIKVISILEEQYDYREESIGENNDDNPYDEINIDEIKQIIDHAYQDSDNEARGNEYWHDQISIIGETFLETWPDNKQNFGRDYLRWSNNNELMVIPNLDNLLGYDDFLMTITDYGSDFSVDDLFRAFIEYNGSISSATDSGYTSWEDANYEYFNERTRERLEDENIDYDFKSTLKESLKILSFKDYFIS
tara:strand:- start:70383 stop:73748 length:3366 start_codon:yes stop_codon:yes gene_type:complete